MQKIPNYAQLWQEIYQARNTTNRDHEDHWEERAQEFFDRVQNRWQTPDSTRTIIRNTVQSLTDPTLIDIGSGPGNFTFFIAPHCKQVIAIDPSESMRRVFQKEAQKQNLTNVTMIAANWAEADIQPKSADITYSAHSIYGDPDVKGFIKKMDQVTKHRCFILVRVPAPDTIMAQVANLIWSQPYDSPNFQIVYNTLLQMGIFADVNIETPNGWKPVFSENVDEAFEKIKTHFNLLETQEYDQEIMNILQNNLNKTETGNLRWPKWGESALISWTPTNK